MLKKSLLFAFTILSFISSFAQQTREELERQRAQLRKEIQETQKLLDANKKQTSENLLQWKLISNKVDLQDKVITNLNKNLRILDDNIYLIQKDINRYDRLLDTLKREYANSMVYAYKNRGNYDFLNFIFSADNFNDAIKRVAYLKSYRDYREMQGQNIIRTQDLRRKRIDQLNNNKKDKTSTLEEQSVELKELETQQQEKDRIVNELKKQGGALSQQIGAKQRQMQKVTNAIAAEIKRVQAEARKAALAKAAEEDRKRKEAEKLAAAKRAEEERARRAAEEAAKNNAKNNPATTPPVAAKPVRPSVPAPKPPVATPAPAPKPVSVLLNTSEAVALNSRFENNRGSLPWPVDNGYPIMRFGPNKLPSGTVLMNDAVTISSGVGTTVKSVFDGTVQSVMNVDEMSVVMVLHGKYFTTYSNLVGVTVTKGQQVRTGQVLGKVGTDLDGGGSIDFYVSSEDGKSMDPEKWLRRR